MELLERETELEVLEAAATAADQGDGAVVVVSGEAGIGKTQLMRAFARSRGTDTRFLWGGCDDLATPRALGPFHDIALQVGGELRQVLWEGGARAAVFDAVFEAVDTGIQTTVVILEDVHWADEATMDVIKFLGRRIGRLGAVLVLTYRAEEVVAGHPLLPALGDLPSSEVRRLQLSPLTETAVAKLAASRSDLTEELYELTRGNPFLVTEALMADGATVPATVRDAIQARTARLSSAGRAVADFVSVVPSQTERWLVSVLPEFTQDGLEECRDRGLIEFDSDAIWYRHELVRGAVEESLTPHRRRELNALAYAELAERDEDFARIVHHARRAEDAEAIAQYAPMAGRHAAASASHREAVAHLRLAVEYAGGASLEDRAATLTDYARECYLTNDPMEALDASRKALEAWRELGDDEQVGVVLRLLSRLHWWLGNGDEAERAGIEAIEVLESVAGSSELAMAYSNLGQVYMLAQRSGSAEKWATKAIELARSTGDHRALAHALNNLGSARVRIGDLSGYGLLEQSLEISLLENLDEHAGRAYANLIWTALDNREYHKADRLLEDGLEFAKQTELAGSIYYITAERARLAFERGDWARAEEDARWVLGRPEEPGITRMPALATWARLSVRRGDPEASNALDEAWKAAEPTGELQRIAPVAAARAESAWLSGDQSAVVEAIADAYGLSIAAGQPWILDEMAFWMWRAGETVAPLTNAKSPYAMQIAGSWQPAAAAWRELGCPYEQATAMADSEEPSTLLEALEIYDGLGALPAGRLVRERLRRMGVKGVRRGPRAETRSNPAGLTPRQAEVLALLTDGMTNGEIAERLYVSRKTIDHHVSALLTKLDVKTRHEAVVVAKDRGLV